MQQLKPYKHSGGVTPQGLIAGLAVGLVAGYAGGTLVAYCEKHVPIIYANLLVVGGVAFGAPAAACYTMRNLSVRNGLITGLVGLATALLALYTSWVTWVGLIVDSPRMPAFWDRFLNPMHTWDLAVMINVEGTWALGRSSNEAVKGEILWGVWGVEALTYVGLGPWAARLAMQGVFCERCSIWTPSPQTVAVFESNPDQPRVVDAFKRGDFDTAFATVQVLTVQTNPLKTLQLSDQCCQRCRRTRAVTLQQVTTTLQKDGNTKTENKVLFDRLLLTEDQAGILDSHLTKYADRQAAAMEKLAAEPSPEAS